MCGIVATRAPRAGAAMLAELRHLEYRGYDSAGIAVLDAGGRLQVQRAVGPLDALVDSIGDDPGFLDPPSCLAVGHTRWATHGAVHVGNAHPVLACDNSVAVVHNGVLDNAVDLRAELELAGHRFSSAVDSEVIAHLVEHEIALGTIPFDALRKAVARLHGSWAIATLIDGTDAIFLARHRSPLVIRGTARHFVAASDAAATCSAPGPLRALADGDVAELGRRWRWAGASGSDHPPPVLAERRPPRAGADPITGEPPRQLPGGATASEIREQYRLVEVLVDTILSTHHSGREWRRLGLPAPKRVVLLGCGTSYHAAQVTARMLTTVAGLPAAAVIASEYDRRFDAPDLVVAISQSGETADVLAALDAVDVPVLAITNNVHSSIARQADAVIDCRAGTERGVAATKTFTAQLLCGVGLAIAAAHSAGNRDRARAAARRLAGVPEQFAAAGSLGSPVDAAQARELAACPGWLFLGTGSGMPYAAEGALKLKEITYRWAHSYPAAELKHGPLALVQRGTPAVIVDNGTPRLATTMAELRARGAHVIRLGAHPGTPPSGAAGDPPWGPIHTVPALQHLALAVATALGRDIDRPRNLAKSVTVG